MKNTKIEWTDSSWNPIRGCSRVSEGCRNCYAEGVAHRFSRGGLPYEGLTTNGRWNGNIKFVEEHLLDPLKWWPKAWYDADDGTLVTHTRRRIFVNSMSDLFHENMTDEMRDKIFAVMALCPQHIFQVLTKRPERMRKYITAPGRTSSVYNAAAAIIDGDFSRMSIQMAHHRSSGDGWWPLPNVWLGVSVENQKAADERIPLLLQTPAAVRFISSEPLLSPINIERWTRIAWSGSHIFNPPGGQVGSGLDWAIVGGESGPCARPMHPDWVRSLRDQCLAAGVPFFFKQWGEWEPSFHFVTQFADIPRSTPVCRMADDGFIGHSQAEMEGHSRSGLMVRAGKKHAGYLIDGREWKQFPQTTALTESPTPTNTGADSTMQDQEHQ